MGDAADILGVKSSGPLQVTSLDEVGRLAGQPNKTQVREKMAKPKGMSRELFALMGKDGIAPAIQPAKNIGTAFKSKWTSALKGKWVFGEYSSSARLDKYKFKHWMKADVDYQDYTYAKFNVRSDPVTYTDEEYDELLQSSTWTRSETDHLMFLGHKYDLRWPVIVDRYVPKPPRTSEDLQARYYLVVTRVRAHRSNANEAQMRNEAHSTMDMESERVRRMQQEIYMRKAMGNNEKEEKELRNELKKLDAEIKKLKKAAKPNGGAANGAASSSSSSSLGGASKQVGSTVGVTVTPLAADEGTVSMPEPVSGRPALQSSRLMVLESTPGMSTTLSKKANWMLRELNVPDYPMPTRTVCDMLDTVRKDVVSLLGLQNTVQQKERELQMTLQAMHEIAPDGRRSGSMGVSGTGNETVIPHSMLASRTEYRPAQLSQPLTSSTSSGALGPGLRKVSSQKRKDSGGVALDGSVDAYYAAGTTSIHMGGGGGGAAATQDVAMAQRPSKRRK